MGDKLEAIKNFEALLTLLPDEIVAEYAKVAMIENNARRMRSLGSPGTVWDNELKKSYFTKSILAKINFQGKGVDDG